MIIFFLIYKSIDVLFKSPHTPRFMRLTLILFFFTEGSF